MAEREKLRKLLPWAVAVVALGVAAVLATWNPSEHLFPKCLFHAATGLHCPGCGSQRAIHNLLRGNIAAALHFNLLVVVALPIVLVGYVRWTLSLYRSRWQITWRAPAIWIWTFLAGILLFAIFRNISVYPFSLLAPPTGV